MPQAHRGRSGSSLLLPALLLLLIAAVAVGCGAGGDPFEGSWIQESVPGVAPQPPIVVKKVGEEYSVTAQGGGTQGYVLHDTMEGSTWANVYSMILTEDSKATKEGDKLKLPSGDKTVEITASGGKLTMTVPGINGVYTLSRAPEE